MISTTDDPSLVLSPSSPSTCKHCHIPHDHTTASQPQSEPSSPHTHPWRTFDFETISKSKRFAYLADPLMRRGYSVQHSRRNVFLSLFAFHNESLNIWTHLLGGILFSILLYSWYSDLYSPTNSLGQFLQSSEGFTTPPGLFVEMLQHRLKDLQQEAHLAFKQVEQVLEISVNNAEEVAKQVAEAMKSNNPAAKLAYFLQTHLPTEIQIQANSAISSWIQAESKVMETLKADAIKIRETCVQWMETVARNEPQKLAAFISSLPSGLDTESRRAAAAVKSWLNNESRIVDELFLKIAQPSTVASWPLLVFCFGAVMCLGSSAVYHWWVGYCEHTHDFMCRIDLGGISFMIWGSSVPLVYYVFYHDKQQRDLYLTVGTLLCASTLLLAALPANILHRIRRIRVASYVGAGAFAVLPLAHACYKWGLDSDEVRRYANDGGLVIVGLLYLLGAVVYVARWPEVSFPGRFDLVGASHQIWHLMVLASAIVHYNGVVELFNWRVERETSFENEPLQMLNSTP